ncbi:MAG TPA: hypothetical protein VEA80_00930 [Vitreimonas sp.]|nr:hypothetical protein [Vitreimonas sp.]
MQPPQDIRHNLRQRRLINQGATKVACEGRSEAECGAQSAARPSARCYNLVLRRALV